MFKAYKYRLYPTESQKVLIHKHFGAARWVYNYGLAKKISAYQEDKKYLNKFDLCLDLPMLKKQKETTWLKEVNAQSLQASLENLDRAYTKFFRDKNCFPKFKAKHDSRQSFQVPQRASFDFKNSELYLPKFKNGIKAVFHRDFNGTIKTATISITPTGKYFVSALINIDEPIPLKKPIDESKAVGIDLGIKTFATLSDGQVIENPRHLKKSLRRLKMRQRSFSRKTKGGSNREKAKRTLAIVHEKVANRRRDFLHKTTTEIVKKYDTICLETLNVSGMIKNHCLAQALSDVSLSKFNELLEYKSEWHGKNILRIGRFEPSSRLCTCGTVNKELKLSDRVWTCKTCNATHDRDVLASNNIKRMAFHPSNLKTTAGTAESHALQTRFPVTGAGKEDASLIG